MNSASQVDKMVANWKQQGMTKTEIIINTAEAELGWCYVWGATGQQCVPSKRRYYAGRSSCPAGEAERTINQCQVCKGTKSVCNGCKWYPNGEKTLMDDCQGFVKQTAGRVGIKFAGAGATTMWTTNSNWSRKGTIDTLPEQLCCIFWQSTSDRRKMSHVAWYIGGGMMIECSGTVKKGKLSKKATHWAVPKALEGGELPVTLPTLRKGSTNKEYVTKLQTLLIQRGYDLNPYGADGKFGDKTLAAVKAFQRDNDLPSDGVVGSQTWGALLDNDTVYYTVTVKRVTKNVAESIVTQYGGTMTKEEAG